MPPKAKDAQAGASEPNTAAFLAQLIDEVAEKHHERFFQILEPLELFCNEHLAPLEEEYLATCQLLLATCCQDGTPVVGGRAKPESWAAGVLWTIGVVNFLTDKSFQPVLSGQQVAKGFGVSVATMQAKSREIRDGLGIAQFDPRWTLPSMMAHNPAAWLLETEEGFIFDARSLPREAQQELFEEGLIPFVPHPDDRGTGLTVLPGGRDD